MSPDGGNPTREKRVATSGDIFYVIHPHKPVWMDAKKDIKKEPG